MFGDISERKSGKADNFFGTVRLDGGRTWSVVNDMTVRWGRDVTNYHEMVTDRVLDLLCHCILDAGKGFLRGPRKGLMLAFISLSVKP